MRVFHIFAKSHIPKFVDVGIAAVRQNPPCSFRSITGYVTARSTKTHGARGVKTFRQHCNSAFHRNHLIKAGPIN